MMISITYRKRMQKWRSALHLFLNKHLYFRDRTGFPPGGSQIRMVGCRIEHWDRGTERGKKQENPKSFLVGYRIFIKEFVLIYTASRTIQYLFYKPTISFKDIYSI